MTSRATFFNFARYYSQNMKQTMKGKYLKNQESVKYGYIKYFPRNPGQVDPPFEPSKLLLVKQVKSFFGRPWWEKQIIRGLGFESQTNDPVIVKNTPEICVLLWKVKHLVKILPIKLPDKLPTADDLNGTYLHENGTFYVIPKVDPAREEATEKFVNDPKKLNRDIIQEKLRLKWLEGRPMS